MNFDFKCPFTPEEIADIRQSRIDAVWEWVMKRYPSLRLETLESNLTYFEEIKKYDDACRVCTSTQQCPTLDGNRMMGELMPDGHLRVWMQGCPQGHKLPKQHSEYRPKQRDWRETQ